LIEDVVLFSLGWLSFLQFVESHQC